MEGSAFIVFSFSDLITPLSLGARQGEIRTGGIRLTKNPGIGVLNLERYRIPSARFFRRIDRDTDRIPTPLTTARRKSCTH